MCEFTLTALQVAFRRISYPKWNIIISFNERNHVKGGKSQMLFPPKEMGQGLIEYAMILVFVALVVIVALSFGTRGW